MDDVVKPRDIKELKSKVAPSPDTTNKKFLTINSPGVTAPTTIPKDFSAKSIFPALRPRKLADLAAMTKEYYLFHHGVWFTWGGIQYDPLLEFYFKDGELNKCVSLVPLKEKVLYGVAREPLELGTESALFAIPRHRMRDVLWWLDGVAIAEQGSVKWVSTRQHLPIDRTKTGFDDTVDTEYLSFYGFRDKTVGFCWFYYRNGFAVGRKIWEPEPPKIPSIATA